MFRSIITVRKDFDEHEMRTCKNYLSASTTNRFKILLAFTCQLSKALKFKSKFCPMAQATGYLSSRCHQKVTVTQKTMHLAHSGRVNFPKDKLEKSTSFLPHVIKLNVIQSHGNEYTNMLEQIHYDILLPFLRLWRTFCSHFFPRHFDYCSSILTSFAEDRLPLRLPLLEVLFTPAYTPTRSSVADLRLRNTPLSPDKEKSAPVGQ